MEVNMVIGKLKKYQSSIAKTYMQLRNKQPCFAYVDCVSV